MLGTDVEAPPAILGNTLYSKWLSARDEIPSDHVSRARRRSMPGVVPGLRIMQISNITDVISKFVHITHECMDSKKLIM